MFASIWSPFGFPQKSLVTPMPSCSTSPTREAPLTLQVLSDPECYTSPIDSDSRNGLQESPSGQFYVSPSGFTPPRISPNFHVLDDYAFSPFKHLMPEEHPLPTARHCSIEANDRGSSTTDMSSISTQSPPSPPSTPLSKVISVVTASSPSGGASVTTISSATTVESAGHGRRDFNNSVVTDASADAGASSGIVADVTVSADGLIQRAEQAFSAKNFTDAAIYYQVAPDKSQTLHLKTAANIHLIARLSCILSFPPGALR
jgi:hypothetical protein